jgi:spermidine/putrescine transport system ATP-binding protein
MQHGRIVQLGSPAEIYDAPRNSFVQNFFGRSLLIDGVLEGTAPDAMVRCLDGTTVAVGGCDVDHGAAVQASVRVEDMYFGAPPPHASGAWEAITTTVRDVRFLGEKVECDLLVGGAAVAVHLPRGAAIGAGETLVLHVARERIRVWPRG